MKRPSTLYWRTRIVNAVHTAVYGTGLSIGTWETSRVGERYDQDQRPRDLDVMEQPHGGYHPGVDLVHAQARLEVRRLRAFRLAEITDVGWGETFQSVKRTTRSCAHLRT